MRSRVLFVDDEQAVLDGLRRMLGPHQDEWDMTFVTCPDDALHALHHAHFDAVVTDVVMPHTDGFHLLREMAQCDRTKDIPVIMLTGSNEAALKRRALDMGATDLINKPIAREDLLARLRNVLRLKAYQDELRHRNQDLESRVRERTEELRDSQLEIIWRLARAAEFRDIETGNHVMRVGCYCRILAETLALGHEFVDTIFLASPLHDIGKIGIPDSVLLKGGALDPHEWEIMKHHCAIGADILRDGSDGAEDSFGLDLWRGSQRPRGEPNPILRMASTIALTHHEWWDGSGYPSGLVSERIPLESRIVALADVYDAVRSHRPYKWARSEEETLTTIANEVGRHFDPAVYAAFEKSVVAFREVRAELSDEVLTLSGMDPYDEQRTLCR